MIKSASDLLEGKEWGRRSGEYRGVGRMKGYGGMGRMEKWVGWSSG